MLPSEQGHGGGQGYSLLTRSRGSFWGLPFSRTSEARLPFLGQPDRTESSELCPILSLLSQKPGSKRQINLFSFLPAPRGELSVMEEQDSVPVMAVRSTRLVASILPGCLGHMDVPFFRAAMSLGKILLIPASFSPAAGFLCLLPPGPLLLLPSGSLGSLGFHSPRAAPSL